MSAPDERCRCTNFQGCWYTVCVFYHLTWNILKGHKRICLEGLAVNGERDFYCCFFKTSVTEIHLPLGNRQSYKISVFSVIFPKLFYINITDMVPNMWCSNVTIFVSIYLLHPQCRAQLSHCRMNPRSTLSSLLVYCRSTHRQTTTHTHTYLEYSNLTILLL